MVAYSYLIFLLWLDYSSSRHPFSFFMAYFLLVFACIYIYIYIFYALAITSFIHDFFYIIPTHDSSWPFLCMISFFFTWFFLHLIYLVFFFYELQERNSLPIGIMPHLEVLSVLATIVPKRRCSWFLEVFVCCKFCKPVTVRHTSTVFSLQSSSFSSPSAIFRLLLFFLINLSPQFFYEVFK